LKEAPNLKKLETAGAMTPLERAARAMADALANDSETDAWMDAEDDPREFRIDGTVNLEVAARAVLAAIREPSEGMRQAGESIGDEECIPTNDGYAQLSADGETKIWQAMIDAMLAEGGDEMPPEYRAEPTDAAMRHGAKLPSGPITWGGKAAGEDR
jgi:hypothetical protein